MRIKICWRFICSLFKPFDSIFNNLYKFIIWFIVAIVCGLAGFWLPLLITSWAKQPSIYNAMIQAGTLVSFSMVLIADGFASVYSINTENEAARGIRGIAIIIAFIVGIIEAGIMVFCTTVNNPQIPAKYHITMTIIAVVLAIYMYCLKDKEWEPNVWLEKINENEIKEITQLTDKAQAILDDDGIKL